MPSKRTTVPLGITINKQTKAALDKVLTPSGFFEPPKGSYSQLVNGLLNGFLETSLKSDLFTILEFCGDNPDASSDELRDYFNARI